MPEFFPFIIVAIIVIFITVAVIHHKKEKARTLAIATWAAARGLHFDGDKDYGFDNRFGHFDVFNKGSERYAHNIASGSHDGLGLWCFDYHYETYSTDSKGNRQTHHHRSSNIVLDTRMHLTPLVIRAENVFDKLGGMFGFDDIDFESAEFSRKFFVKSPDKRWAYDVINQRNMETLLASPRFVIELKGAHVLLRRNSRFGPDVYDQALRLATALLAGIPKDVVAARRLEERA